MAVLYVAKEEVMKTSTETVGSRIGGSFGYAIGGIGLASLHIDRSLQHNSFQ